jgi:membrane-associated phospholipid phosphatase
MPRLHVAYALVVGLSLILAERTLWVRFLAGLYPLAMSAAVVITANHWLLDVAGAFVTVALAGLVVLALVLLQTMVYPRVMRLRLAERSP